MNHPKSAFYIMANSWLLNASKPMKAFMIMISCIVNFATTGLPTISTSFPSTVDKLSSLAAMDKPPPIFYVEVLIGGTAQLPCKIINPQDNDQVHLILWFKDNTTKPIYSLDARGWSSSESQGIDGWTVTSSLGKRTSFRASSPYSYRSGWRRWPNILEIDNVTLKDQGLYRCRVDYRNIPTKNMVLNLSVIVPLTVPSIRNSNNEFIKSGTSLGPFRVGHEVVLECAVEGGYDNATLSWWIEGVRYDTKIDQIFKRDPDKNKSRKLINRIIYRISPEKILPSIGTASFSKNKQNWQYDPWLRQFSTWFICRATNGRNNTSDASILETSIQVHASVSADLYDKNGLNPYAREYFQSSPPVQMGQEKPATFKNDVREPSNIDGFYLFKALCKKILGRTDYIAQDHSLIAKGDVMTMNNVSRAIPPDLILSNQVITALQTQSIKPQCEFVFQKFHHNPQNANAPRKTNAFSPRQKQHRHNHGNGIQITEAKSRKSSTRVKTKKVPSDYLMSSVGGIITTDYNDKPFVLLHPKRKGESSFESTFIFDSTPSSYCQTSHQVHHSTRIYFFIFWIFSKFIFLHCSL